MDKEVDVKEKKLMTLDIFGQKFSVYQSDISDEYLGQCSYKEQRIDIHPEAQGDLFLETLLHEFLHALFFRMSYKQSGIPHALEEVMIDQIAKCLVENFKITKK
jgi:hypothetical protein